MIPVIDVFAGPGGLNEGFSSVRNGLGERVFKTVASIEMEHSAVQTLRLRSAMRTMHEQGNYEDGALQKFLREGGSLEALKSDDIFSVAYQEAKDEVHQFELSMESRAESDKIISDALNDYDGPWVLIGGPPCQAYSLAGRSRRTHDTSFEDDHKHFLYREYLNIIKVHQPTVFVMENVKGMLSSVNRGKKTFDLIRADLENQGDGIEYDLYSMVHSRRGEDLKAEDFLIYSEKYGVPQKRHRVIIIGVKKDSGLGAPELLQEVDMVTVGDAIHGLPPLRSTVSRQKGVDDQLWYEARKTVKKLNPTAFKGLVCKTNLPVSSRDLPQVWQETGRENIDDYRKFVRPAHTSDLPTWNHEARGHMVEDLIRYGMLSSLSRGQTASLKVRNLDESLWPNHKNIHDDVVPFADRFRVQIDSLPSTTVVSHIAKDGHYYIHPDPTQMRSLTVREAARLQTFPDDYIFLGNRTEQFTQVGNAVPPLLAKKIGNRIRDLILGHEANSNQALQI